MCIFVHAMNERSEEKQIPDLGQEKMLSIQNMLKPHFEEKIEQGKSTKPTISVTEKTNKGGKVIGYLVPKVFIYKNMYVSSDDSDSDSDSDSKEFEFETEYTKQEIGEIVNIVKYQMNPSLQPLSYGQTLKEKYKLPVEKILNFKEKYKISNTQYAKALDDGMLSDDSEDDSKKCVFLWEWRQKRKELLQTQNKTTSANAKDETA